MRIATKDVGEDGTFSGYGSVFDVQDGGYDIVMPGAFAASLGKHQADGTSVKLLWQHDPREPIGIWLDLREDNRGLICRGRIFTEFERGRQALACLRHGAIDGLSIGYDCILSEVEEQQLPGGPSGPGPSGYGYGPIGYTPSIRRLKEIDLWEVSLVTFPMNTEARVETVKSPRRRAVHEPRADGARPHRPAGQPLDLSRRRDSPRAAAHAAPRQAQSQCVPPKPGDPT